ncbi:MAG: methylmalonyl-CoA mutase family protein [Calditrichia bacterium]
MNQQDKDQLNKPLNLSEDFSPATTEEWKAAAEKLLKGAPFEKVMLTKTYEGITLQPIYWAHDVKDLEFKDSLPGHSPYSRAAKIDDHYRKGWEVAQEIPEALPKKFNAAIRHDLNNGQNALNIRLDEASLRGLDSDQAGQVAIGKGGLCLSTMEDLEQALEGIDLSRYPVYIYAGASGLVVGAFLAAYARKKGISLKELRGGIGCDPIGELAQAGSIPHPLSRCYEHIGNLGKWLIENAPGMRFLTVDVSRYADAGGSADLELAVAMATAAEYLRQMAEQGLEIDQIAQRMRFSFSLGSNYFIEIAKLRAARLLWANLVKAFGGNEDSQKMFIHACTTIWNKTVLDPYVNMLRTTTEAFSGVVGGADSLQVLPFDAPIRPADDFSRRIARNTQTILREEAHLDQVIDPAGGSWFVEWLTDQLAQKAWKSFQEIEKNGGILEALKSGMVQSEVIKIREARLKNLASRKDKLVGTNIYPNPDEKLLPNTHSPKQVAEERTNYLADYRTSGDIYKHIKPLEKLADLLEASSEDLFEATMEAALSGATLGEISKTIYGSDPDSLTVDPLPRGRAAEMFEQLRKAMLDYKNTHGETPRVFLANMGPVSQHRIRADFSAGFFRVGGFEIVDNRGFATPEEAAEAAAASGAPIAVICSTDDTYPELVPAFTRKLKSINPEILVILAGYPKDQVEAHKQAGVDDFIHIRANVYELLAGLMKKLGVLQ